MTPHLKITVHETSQIGEARRAAARLSAQAKFDEVTAGQVALIVTELASNLARHAKGGRILLGLTDGGALDVLSLDDGPGMVDVKVCLRDGYSTGGGTPGTGLGAAQRMASVFSAFSVAGKGSVLYARIDRQKAEPSSAAPITPRFSVAGINLPAPGEQTSGDGWHVRTEGDTAAVMLADGLGHGPIAAEASDVALKALINAADVATSPSQILERAHHSMRSTRGAAVASAVLNAQAGTLRFAGVGNICGRILSGVEDRSLMSQHGTVGHQFRSAQDIDYVWPAHALVILHSDGLATRWSLAETPGLLNCEPAVLAGWLLREHSRGRDDATVVVLRRTR